MYTWTKLQTSLKRNILDALIKLIPCFFLCVRVGTPPNTADNSNYATQTFQAIQHPNNATASTVFTSVMGQGQCATPMRFALRGGNSPWTQGNTTDAGKADLH